MEPKNESESSDSSETGRIEDRPASDLRERDGLPALTEGDPRLPDTLDSDEIQEWEDEPEDDDSEPIFKGEVTESDKFLFAQRTLLAASVIFVILALTRVFVDGDGIEDVWNFGSVAINSIVALILGYYFGKK